MKAPESGTSALECAAALTVCRSFVFFCSPIPYTAAAAAGMAGAVLLTAVILLPLLHAAPRAVLGVKSMYLLRFAALLTALRLLWDFYALLIQLHCPHPVLLLAAVILLLLRLTALPQAALHRAAVLLCYLLAAGLLLLPVRTLRTANPITLWTPGNARQAFFSELSRSSELLLLPMLLPQHPSRRTALRSTAVWLGFRGLVLPAAVLLGAMQNGRLTKWQGNPFFLLLARTPLSDALRTDGLWMAIAVSCGILSAALFLRLGLRGTGPLRNRIPPPHIPARKEPQPCPPER